MIVRINDNDDYMEKLSAQPKFVNVTDKLGLENGKHVQDQTVRDTIRVKFLIEEYTEYNCQYHTVSHFINVVSNNIKQNISSIQPRVFLPFSKNVMKCIYNYTTIEKYDIKMKTEQD